MTDLNLQQAIELNQSLSQQEKHFHKQGVCYRITAAGWLLAILVCYGVIFLKLDVFKMNIDMNLLLSMTGYAGCMGMFILWNLDSGLNNRLLNAVVEEGLKLEAGFPTLPQVRHNMMALHAGRGWQARVNWFYALPVLVLLAFTTFNVQHVFQLDGWRGWALWIGTLFIYSSVSFYIRNESTVNLRRKGK